MSRDTNLRRKYYKLICLRDGERCRVCGKTPPEIYLEVDHIDGDKSHNPSDLSNFQLLCRTHNRKKDPRGKAGAKGQEVEVKRRVVMTSTYKEVMDQTRMSPEMYQSRRAEPRFRHWLYEKMKTMGRMPVAQIVASGAEYAQCSTYAVRMNYLVKAYSDEGMYVRYYDEANRMWMVTFRNQAAIGVMTEAVDFESMDEQDQ